MRSSDQAWYEAWYERGRLAGKAEGLREAAAKFRDNQFVRRMDQRGIADWLDQKAAEIEAQLAGKETPCPK